MHDDGVKVINVCNTNVLHILEGSNRKRPVDIRVHGAGRGVRKGSKEKHVVHRTCFVDGELMLSTSTCARWVVVVCGGSVGVMAPHGLCWWW